MQPYGVYSEVGKLRKVIIHRPDLSLQRLTPSNHDELLFDDVVWIERLKQVRVSCFHPLSICVREYCQCPGAVFSKIV